LFVLDRNQVCRRNLHCKRKSGNKGAARTQQGGGKRIPATKVVVEMRELETRGRVQGLKLHIPSLESGREEGERRRFENRDLHSSKAAISLAAIGSPFHLPRFTPVIRLAENTILLLPKTQNECLNGERGPLPSPSRGSDRARVLRTLSAELSSPHITAPLEARSLAANAAAAGDCRTAAVAPPPPGEAAKASESERGPRGASASETN